jgi:hypothetical protein
MTKAERILASHPTMKIEYLAVKQLGDAIGYGNLMSMASAIWKAELLKSGAPETGAFVPTIASFIKDEYQDTLKDGEVYDEVVKHLHGR